MGLNLSYPRSIVALLFSLVLTTCGGGSGSPQTPPASPAPSSTNSDQASSQSAGLSAVLDSGTGQMTLSWTDTFTDETGYEIDLMNGSGNWSPQETLPAISNIGTQVHWQRMLAGAGSYTYRVLALVGTGNLPLQTPQHTTQVTVTIPATAPTIQMDQSQPLSSKVTLSVTGATSATLVNWYVDLNSIGTSNIGPDFSQSWDSSTVSNGTHLLIARIETSPDAFLEVRTTIQVSNSGLNVSLILPGSLLSPGANVIAVSATSIAGIASVQLLVDGTSAGTLTAPNYYSPFNASNLYEFTGPFVPGSHSVTAIATDINGATARATGTFVAIPPAPTVAVTSPVADAIVSGTLNLQGTFAPTTNVTLTATLGNYPILNTQNSPFSTNFDLSGLPAGTYTLTIQATPSDPSTPTTVVQRNVTVEVSPAFSYTPVVTLGSSGLLLAAENNMVLYKSGNNGSIRLRDTNTSTEVVLLGADAIQYAYDWVLNNGRVFVSGIGTDAPIGSHNYPQEQIYEWETDGSRHNLSQLVGNKSDEQNFPVAHWPWVLWGGRDAVPASPGFYILLNLQTGTSQIIGPPTGSNSILDGGYDFFLSGSTVNFYFSADTSSASASSIDIFQWDSASQQSVKLTSAGMMQSGIQTDGTLLAWRSAPFDNGYTSVNLLGATTAVPTAQTLLSTDMFQFQVKDGLLAWAQGHPHNLPGLETVKVSDGNTVTSLTNAGFGDVAAVGGGAVLYATGDTLESSRLLLWTPTEPARTVLDGFSGNCILTGQYLYFTNGGSQILYRVIWR